MNPNHCKQVRILIGNLKRLNRTISGSPFIAGSIKRQIEKRQYILTAAFRSNKLKNIHA
jgi:hypothetical protein